MADVLTDADVASHDAQTTPAVLTDADVAMHDDGTHPSYWSQVAHNVLPSAVHLIQNTAPGPTAYTPPANAPTAPAPGEDDGPSLKNLWHNTGGAAVQSISDLVHRLAHPADYFRDDPVGAVNTYGNLIRGAVELGKTVVSAPGAAKTGAVTAPPAAEAPPEGAPAAPPEPPGPSAEPPAGGVAGVLSDSANKQYSSALNATTRGNKARSAEIVPQLIRRGITGSVRSIAQQSADKLQTVGQQLSDAYEDLPAGSSIPLADVTGKIQQAANNAFTVPTASGPLSPSPVADAGLNHTASIINRLTTASDLDPLSGERTIPVDTARRLRQYYDSVAADAGRYDGKALADQTAGAAHGMAADAIRQQLASDFPDIAKINKEYSFWKDVNKVTSDTLLRRQGQASSPLSTMIARGAGEAAGSVVGGPAGAVAGGVIGNTLQKLFNSGSWKTTSAVIKNDLANALASGSPGRIAIATRRAMLAPAVSSAARTRATPAAALPAAAQGDQQPQP
ncbi:MAG: hypothetical protein ACLPWF_04635 [Bryobacteraceae bacterium]